LGRDVSTLAPALIAGGADQVLLADHPDLEIYRLLPYAHVLTELVRQSRPEILLIGATSLGVELAPRVAARLGTGLSAHCINLDLDEKGRLLQMVPGWGGGVIAAITCPDHRPQMATVHPGIFSELPHRHEATGRIIYPEAEVVPDERVELIRSRPEQAHKGQLEDASVVLVGGRGLGSHENFQMLFEAAALLGGDVAATRPVVKAGWADDSRLLGQTGKSVKPKLLISIGTSGALQYTTGIQGAENIVAVNRDPRAPIFKMADLGLVGDAKTVLSLLLEKLRKRL